MTWREDETLQKTETGTMSGISREQGKSSPQITLCPVVELVEAESPFLPKLAMCVLDKKPTVYYLLFIASHSLLVLEARNGAKLCLWGALATLRLRQGKEKKKNKKQKKMEGDDGQ